jgi:hypothetical protein
MPLDQRGGQHNSFAMQLKNIDIYTLLGYIEFVDSVTWDRCCDHKFLLYLTIFGEKIGVFLKNQCYDQIIFLISFVFSQKRHFFRQIFRRKYLKNHNIGPRWFWGQFF